MTFLSRQTIIGLLLVAAAASAASGRDIYVASDGNNQAPGTLAQPLKTLAAARNAARKLKTSVMPHDGICIVVRGGVYRLDETLVLGPEDSGTAERPIVWRAYKDERPVISGGMPVIGWEPHTNGIWKTKLNRADKLRQLYVNGRAACMAMCKKELHPLGWRGTYVTTGKEPWAADAGISGEGFAFESSEFPAIADPQDMEIQQRRRWTIQRLNVAGIRTERNEKVVVFGQPAGAIGQHLGWNCGITLRPSWLYNAYEFLTQPGEFYFDRTRQILYYMPRPDEDMTKVEIVAPVLEKLVVVQGPNLKQHAHDLWFEGLTFAHTRWDMMKLDDSYGAIILQSSAVNVIFKNDGNWHANPWGRYTVTDIPAAAVEVNGAERVRFHNNIFTLLGCIGLKTENDVQYIEIVGNVFYQVEGAGINVGHPQHVYIGKQNGDNEGFGPYDIDNSHDKWDETVEGLPVHVTVDNNLMRQVCSVWWSMSPITVYYGHHINVNHNDLKDTPYNSITLGWSWAEFNGIADPQKHHADTRKGLYPSHNQRWFTCNYNRIVNPYVKLDDAGALYFIGDFALPAKDLTKQEEYSEVIGNYLVATQPKEGLLYTDEGAAFLKFKRNVLDGPSGLERVCDRGVDGRYKTFAHNFLADVKYKLPPSHDRGVVFADNIFVTRSGPPLKLTDWPAEAQKIINDSGLDPAYRGLFDRIPSGDR